MSQKYLGALCAALAFAAFVPVAQATSIDDFSLSQGPLVSTGNVLVSHTIANDGSFYGGAGATRTVSVRGDGTGSPTSQSTRVEIDSGVFEFASGVGVAGVGTITYDLPGGVDLSWLDAFRFVDLTADHSFDYTVTLEDTMAGSRMIAGTLVGPLTNSLRRLPIADFIGGADMTAIDRMIFSLGTGGQSLDFSLSAISGVPVPVGGLLLVTALGGLGLYRMRRI
ncbi:MAG: VPLPA-CTERM sorting domain-containing protein [Qingshengfaniella sp.]